MTDQAGPEGRTETMQLRPRMLLYVMVPVAALVGWGSYSTWSVGQQADASQRGALDFVPTVQTATAQLASGPYTLALPGQTEALNVANIYARATGYVAERQVDIGSRVKQGNLLLRIAAPDLDHQLAQAQAQLGQMEAALVQSRANLVQAQANSGLARVTNGRTSQLAREGWDTQENADTTHAQVSAQGAAVMGAEAGIGVAEANLRAQQATVDRYQALQAFENVQAPFDGVITARNIEVGDLVNADNGSVSPLFTIQRTDTLRVVVQVPQSAAAGLTDGVVANVAVPELPSRTFRGTVSRTAAALADNSRSIRVEVDLDNRDGVLQPGLYVDASFRVPRAQPAVTIPDAALIFGPGGMQVAVVDGDAVRLQAVSIGHDAGTVAEIASGLAGGERVVTNPPPDLVSGSRVHVADAEPTAGSRPGANR